jgi:hypothetical protein
MVENRPALLRTDRDFPSSHEVSARGMRARHSRQEELSKKTSRVESLIAHLR